MKFKHVIVIIGLFLIATSLNAKSSTGMSDLGHYDIYKSDFEQYGFMGIYSPTNRGYGVGVYGIPKTTEFTARFSYFSLYAERKGSFTGGEFDDSPLDFWEKKDKEIYRKHIINFGSTQAIVPNRKLLLAYYGGLGYYEEFQQYRSIYGNDWFKNNESKIIGDLGLELIGRIGFVNFGIGVSFQSLFYFSAGFEF